MLILDTAFKDEKWKLGPAAKKAKLHDPSITMDNIKQWRREIFVLDKHPNKLNS